MRIAIPGRLLLAGVLAACGGCAITPKVIYEVDRKADYDGLPKFQLQRTAVALTRERDAAGQETGELKVDAAPVDDPNDRVFTIVPADSWGIKTHLGLTHRADSLLVESIGTEIEDQRVEAIQQVGELVGGIVGLARVFGLDQGGRDTREALAPLFPVYLDVAAVARTLDPGKPREGELRGRARARKGQVVLDLALSRVAPDAIEREAFLASVKDKPTRVFFYSACRDLLVRIVKPAAYQNLQYRFRVSDPAFVQTVAFLASGKIDLHAGCGVTTTSAKADIASAAKIANEVVKQVKAVRDAKSAGEGSADAAAD